MSSRIGIRLSGLSDEAGAKLEDQLAAHVELGWSDIEIRSVEGQAIGDWDEAFFKRVLNGISQASLRVSVVASRIANWERPITGDFQLDLEELKNISNRMMSLGAKYVRVMSYPNDGLPELEWGQRVLERMNQLTELAEEHGVILLHENCSGWAGTCPDRALELVEQVNSPNLRLLYDTGNGIAYRYDTYDYLTRVWKYVEHVHIKDGILQEGKEVYTLPGEGDSRVRDSIVWLLKHGYNGIFSIEPHLHLIPHLRQSPGSSGLKASYMKYGQSLEQLLEESYAAKERG